MLKKEVKLPEEYQWNIKNSCKIHGRMSISFACSAFAKVNDCYEAVLLSFVSIC
jgi:hypothetical protein